MNNLLTRNQVFDNSELYIKFMCYDIFITIDNQVFSIRGRELKEQLIGGSYCYYCNGKYRTKKWIKENCVKVLGQVIE